jgi:hypothetical protein
MLLFNLKKLKTLHLAKNGGQKVKYQHLKENYLD